MKENKGATSFMNNYDRMISRVKSEAVVRKQYGGNNDSVIYLSQQELISEAEKSKLVREINKN